ncbi:MAG: sn-glycerol-3-phosphate import ATP-binding protein UgpC [Desulfobacterales bacterium]|jgi:sn-glycerol 3-phosphate transport system ATP-binding protein|nr:sn-glycerol-3-phosphate import ATP-binding protein UgpC [Desulfobacterales bacterium]
MADVSIRNVTKRFGKTEIIHGVSCDIREGEFIVILGPSGCGKSTLLRLIAGLEEITSGEIAIDGRVVNRLEPAQRDIAMVFQNYALYPHMTVYRNMAYGLKIRRMPAAEVDRRVRAAAGILELSELLDRKPRQLSGGQRQRVAMGRCIVREPKVFLFDEPLSNLDAKLRVQMRMEIRKLHEELKITSIFVTHDQVEAMTLGDRLVVMDNGAAAQIGTPLEVYERPANLFVAGFIGSPAMNFLQAEVAADGRRLVLPDGLDVALPGAGVPARAGRRVILGVRPEHLEPNGGRADGIRLAVDHVELLGADTLVHGRCGSMALTVRLADVQRIDKHAVIVLHAPPEKLHLFDPETKARIEK